MDVQADARLILANQRTIYKFMCDLGIDDFSIMDIIKPEPERVRRLLSAIVNFARFRGVRGADWDELIKEDEIHEMKYQEEVAKREDLINKIENLEQHMQTTDVKMKEMERHNSNAESELRQLKKLQEKLVTEHTTYKKQKEQLVNKLKDRAFLLEEGSRAIEQLRPYVVESPEVPQQINNDLNISLNNQREKLDNFERWARALEISGENFKTIQMEVEKCIKIINECQGEIEKKDMGIKRLTNFQEMCEQQKHEESELNRNIQQLNRRLKATEDKIERFRHQAEEKKSQAKARMEQLTDQYSTLIAARAIADQDMERERKNIGNIEKAIVDLRQQIETEIREFESESQKLNAYINAYLNDMEQKITATAAS